MHACRSTLEDPTALLALGRAADAIAPLERCAALPGVVGGEETEFLLARALWDAKRDRPRAVALARHADGTLRAAGRDHREVSAWLARHR